MRIIRRQFLFRNLDEAAPLGADFLSPRSHAINEAISMLTLLNLRYRSRLRFPVALFLFAIGSFVTPTNLLAQTAPGLIDTVAGTGKDENNGTQGRATEINVGQPFGVVIGPDSALYVTEVKNHRILRVDLKEGRITTVVGCGRKGYSGDGGKAIEAELNEPYEVRFDRAGNMYFVEMMNHVIRRVDAKTQVITTIAGDGKQGFQGDGGDARKARFSRPHSIALDQRDGLLVADIGNHRIRRIDLKSGTVETIAGNGKRTMPRDGGLARGNPMIGPRALFVHDNTLWIALREGHSVWTIDLDSGRLAHRAGSGKKGFSGDGGDPKKATFNGPKGIAVGPGGDIFVVDTENQTIRKIRADGKQISTVAGQGPKHRGGRGDGGKATKAEMDRPHGLCLDSHGNIFVGDTLNHRVRRIRTD